jgi:hypothetical protein
MRRATPEDFKYLLMMTQRNAARQHCGHRGGMMTLSATIVLADQLCPQIPERVGVAEILTFLHGSRDGGEIVFCRLHSCAARVLQQYSVAVRVHVHVLLLK